MVAAKVNDTSRTSGRCRHALALPSKPGDWLELLCSAPISNLLRGRRFTPALSLGATASLGLPYYSAVFQTPFSCQRLQVYGRTFQQLCPVAFLLPLGGLWKQSWIPQDGGLPALPLHKDAGPLQEGQASLQSLGPPRLPIPSFPIFISGCEGILGWVCFLNQTPCTAFLLWKWLLYARHPIYLSKPRRILMCSGFSLRRGQQAISELKFMFKYPSLVHLFVAYYLPDMPSSHLGVWEEWSSSSSS